MTHPLDRQESLFSGLEKVTVDRLITELDVLVALIGESQAVRLRRSPKLTHFCSREVTQEESLIPEPFVVEPGVRRLAQAGFPRISPGES